ncbi:tubulin domain-containing protein [Bombardia bombarda]|uniref:Tubulin domain-containing protein n=1 Tax=Bombardia bombarda TaxID=252184 RepID=A0AA39XBE7_9PEZI|nr:tubulin domain-containing protein [Bombardia bombarda]
MHEIITLQLGQQSNYVATHFWNAQESYFTYSDDQESPVNHDVHWRPGIGADGTETFMPRTVIYDLKGGFGTLKRTNALYADQEDGPPQGLWSGPTTTLHQPPIPPSAYLTALDAGLSPATPLHPRDVRYWSDFSRVFYHPRSAIQLNEYELGSSLMPFERYASGEELFSELDKEHDVLDRDLRAFVEEADQMQGVQMVTGLDDAWGGFAARYAERMRDEYGKTPVWVWGVQQEGGGGVSRDKRLLRLINKAKAMTELYKQASIIVPLAVPRALPQSIQLDRSSPWHTSALLASAMESITLPTRLKSGPNRDTLGNMADRLNAMGKQSVAGLQMSFAPVVTEFRSEGQQQSGGDQADSRVRGSVAVVGGGEDEEGGEEEGVRHLDVSFSPSDQLDSYGRQMNGFHHKKPRVFSQVVTARGYAVDEYADEEMMDVDQQDARRRRRNPSAPITRSYNSTLQFPLLDSFPQIFRDDDGEPLKGSVNITSSLSTDTSVSDSLKLLRTTIARSISVEDREALSNDLAEMAEEYHEGWSSGSDSGEDE